MSVDETLDPWTRLSTKTVFDNQWLRLDSHKCLNPAGNPADYTVVHFKNRAVGVIPLHADGTITLVGQYRFALKTYSWELPEGGCPEGQTMLETAYRELMEETGLSAVSMEHFMDLHTSNSVTDEWGQVFLARNLTQGKAQPEDSEELQTKRLSLENILAAIEAKEITDAITVAAIYKLAYLKKPL